MEASCVPASVSMVFSGWGIEISEQELVDSYFQTTKLPRDDLKRGVTNTNTVKGIVQIIEDRRLETALQLDVFVPGLYRFNSSNEDRYITRASTASVRKYGKIFEEGSEPKDFFNALEQLSKKNKIGVYSPNPRMLQISEKMSFMMMLPKSSIRGFYEELSDFISRGHIVGPHGGMTLHTRALDGSRMEVLDEQPDKRGFMLLDPRGLTYPVPPEYLLYVDSRGVRGDMFDYLFRVSPKETRIAATQPGPLSQFLLNIRHLVP